MPEITRWRAAWSGLGIVAPDDELFRAVIGCYSEPQRQYHTVQHLQECFARLDEARQAAERPCEVELAVWFHDAVYDVHRSDNEAQSAAWAREAAERAGLPAPVVGRLAELILATKHDSAPCCPDAALLVDVDLAILAAPTERFQEYERQIRAEYAWAPDFLFRSKRRDILAGFLARPCVYHTNHFQERYEAAARANLAWSIAQLDTPLPSN